MLDRIGIDLKLLNRLKDAMFITDQDASVKLIFTGTLRGILVYSENIQDTVLGLIMPLRLND